MKKVFRYFQVQLKRVLRFLPAVFVVTLVLIFAIAFIAKGLISDKLDDEARQKVELAKPVSFEPTVTEVRPVQFSKTLP